MSAPQPDEHGQPGRPAEPSTPFRPRPASGEQFEITLGEATARIGAVAAVLREFSVAGTHYTETWPDDQLPPMGCGIVLAPWPNRVAGGRWTAPDGTEQQLDLTEVERLNAIHGLLRNTPYTKVFQTSDAVTLTATVVPQPGYPFHLDTTVRYQLTSAGLHVTHSVTNVGAAAAPFGIGAHPYLRVGATPIEELTLTVSATETVTVDDRLIPTGRVPIDPDGPDLRAGRRLSEINCDRPVTGLAAVPGPGGERYEHTLTAPDGSGVTVWTDLAFGWVQLYSPPNFPAPDGKRLAIAIEPMTCGVNALATGDDVLTVEPGETWSASWGISPFGG